MCNAPSMIHLETNIYFLDRYLETDRQADRQTGRQADRQTGRQADRRPISLVIPRTATGIVFKFPV